MSEHIHHKHEPSLPGDDPSVAHGSHIMDFEAHAEMLSLSRSLPAWFPNGFEARLRFIDSFLGAAKGAIAEFPTVFNASGIYNVHRALASRQFIADCTASLEGITTYQRGITGLRNRMMYRREMDTIQNIPRADPAMVIPPGTSPLPFSGLCHIVVAMAEMLMKQPNYKPDVHGRQFGLLPQAAPPVNPDTLSPGGSARVSGSNVVLSFRSPRGVPGAEMVQILCDRGAGAGPEFVATTTHASFTDHHPLPPAGERATYVYYLCFLSRSFELVGLQSEFAVTVQGRVTAA